MDSLLVVSTEVFTGKTGICLSLALKARERGKKVGYMKPVGNLPLRLNGTLTDKDAPFVAGKLGMTETLDIVSPIVLTADRTNRLLHGESSDAKNDLLRAFEQIKKDRDFVVMEGSAHINDGRLFNVSAIEIAELLEAKMLLVTKLDNPYEMTDDILTIKDQMGDRMVGVICNWVKRSQRDLIIGKIAPFLKERGIKFYGFVPRVTDLLSVTVQELVDVLNGQVLCSEERLGENVSTFMVGAMGQEQALRFFQREAGKAVITGGDRADVQLAALETPTKALILTGNYTPSATVLGVAESKGVPVVLVDMDTLTAVEKTESVIGHMRVHEDFKLESIRKLLDEYADLEGVINELDTKS